jgi:hypothetical protein
VSRTFAAFGGWHSIEIPLITRILFGGQKMIYAVLTTSWQKNKMLPKITSFDKKSTKNFAKHVY